MKSGKFSSEAKSFPSTQPRVRWGPSRARDPRPACPRTASVSAPESSPGGGWCDTTITWSYLAILFRSSLPVPGMASINQQPQLATNGRAKMSRRSVAALPSLFRPAPGAKSPCKSELNTAARFQVFQSVTSCLEPNKDTADCLAAARWRMRPTRRLLDRPWWRSRGPRPHPSCRWPGPRCSSPWPRRETMPTDDVVNEIIYVTILMNFLIHELNKFTSIESPSQSLNGHCNCILDEADNRGNRWRDRRRIWHYCSRSPKAK